MTDEVYLAIDMCVDATIAALRSCHISRSRSNASDNGSGANPNIGGAATITIARVMALTASHKFQSRVESELRFLGAEIVLRTPAKRDEFHVHFPLDAKPLCAGGVVIAEADQCRLGRGVQSERVRQRRQPRAAGGVRNVHDLTAIHNHRDDR